MIYKIKDSKRKHRIEAFDKDNNTVGEAVISPFMDADLSEKTRMNIYIDIIVMDVANEIAIKDQMFDEIMKRARIIKEENKNIDVRVYHCCFSDNKENIAYYASKEGFKHDEGMHIIKKEITEENFEIAEIKGIDFVNLELIDEDEINQLIEKQNKVFVSGYSREDLEIIKSEKEWFSIAAKHDGVIIGNIIIIVKENESNIKYGWVDDLFVSKDGRNRGIGENLILRALENLKALNIFESKLEVWSSNKRGLSVYEKIGYKFQEETESSIGMFL